MTPCYYCEADDDACKTCIHSDTYIDPQEEITKLREQVAAQAAVIEKLLTFVKYVAEQTPEKPDYWSSCGQCSSNSDEAEDLLAIPTDSTQILDEVRKQERERVAQMILNGRFLHDESPAAQFAKEVAAAIRAME